MVCLLSLCIISYKAMNTYRSNKTWLTYEVVQVFGRCRLGTAYPNKKPRGWSTFTHSLICIVFVIAKLSFASLSFIGTLEISENCLYRCTQCIYQQQILLSQHFMLPFQRTVKTEQFEITIILRRFQIEEIDGWNIFDLIFQIFGTFATKIC